MLILRVIINKRESMKSGSKHEDAVRSQRLRLWDVHHGHHCSLLGTCLSLKDTRRILRKAQVAGIEGATDYQVHCTAVDLAQHAGTVSRLLDKALERTHSKTWATYRRLTTVAELKKQWRNDRDAGRIAGPFWAVLHHPTADSELITECFGVVHMLSHQVGGGCRRKLRRYDELQAQLRSHQADYEGREREYRARIERLEDELRQADERLIQTQREASVWRSRAEAGDPERVRELEDERNIRIRALARSDRLLRHAREKIQRLQDALLHADRSDPVAVASPGGGLAEYDAAWSMTPAKTEVVAPCEKCDLAGCTVLYVGGERRLVAHLRRATEAANAKLLHHDGGIEDNIRNLRGLCARADFVLCPVSKVGHSAVGHVKRACAEACKPFIPLRRASLDAFSSGLSRAALRRERADSGPSLH